MATRLVEVKNGVHNCPFVVFWHRTPLVPRLTKRLDEFPSRFCHIAIVHSADKLPLAPACYVTNAYYYWLQSYGIWLIFYYFIIIFLSSSIIYHHTIQY